MEIYMNWFYLVLFNSLLPLQIAVRVQNPLELKHKERVKPVSC